MSEDKNFSQKKGPFSYENWHAANNKQSSTIIYEYPLFTDAHLVGNHILSGLGPYQIINAVALPEFRQSRPSLVLRVASYVNNVRLDTEKTDDERYHGGDLADEIASIISLSVGIRLKSGGINRIFNDIDPMGTPVSSWGYTPDPILPNISNPLIIPRVVGTHHLEGLTILATLPSLSPEDAVALIRAARLYQEAIWIAESTPELSWIMLVSAIETAANRWRTSKETPLERLRASKPKLEDILRKGGDDDFVSLVAEQIAPIMGATKKFIDFILEFLPPPPEQRPPELFQYSWTKQAVKKSMRKIYDYRSRALHGGTPFPAPMCLPPRGLTGELEEVPIGYSTSTKGGVWLLKDTPMLIHVFEYIVQGSLLNWWRSLI